MMDICILDFETYWSTTHSLSKMSPIGYVMHPETEIISMAAKFIRNGKPGDTQVIFGEQNIKNVCSRIDWSDMWVIGHNLEGFDSMLCAWRLGIRPKMWGCTLAMSRPHHAKEAGGSLAKLVAHYGIGTKDQTALHATKGRHLKDFSPEEIAAMGEYNKADVDQCYALFRRLIKVTSKDELRLIDMTIRMLVEPKFEVDTALLETTLAQAKHDKAAMLRDIADKIGVNTAVLQDDEAIIENASKILASSAKFSELLRSRNVEVPTKISPTTGKEAPALAKTDEAFIALQNHPDPVVSCATQARLGVKSTLLETRIQAFLDAAAAAGGKLPVPLKYSGADTTQRWSGWAYNPQNLPRVGKDPKPSDALRNCIKAPEGHMVVVADLSGIELRVNHFLWKVPSSMALFRADPEKADLYKDFASKLYDVAPADVSKSQRQIGKIAHLGLQYGAGAATFQKVAKMMGGVSLPEDECISVVNAWREEYRQIAEGWRTVDDALKVIAGGHTGYAVDPWGLVTPAPEGLLLPSGRTIRYPELRRERNEESGKQEWLYGRGRHQARIYGPKAVENIVQALARDVIADNALAVKKATGLLPSLMVHDELVYVVPESEAEAHLAVVQEIMRTPPPWWPELVTWSEGAFGMTYGEAK